MRKITTNLKEILINLKQHMPAITVGICCWVFIWIVTGTSCVFRSLTGLPCPGCGSTRAVGALLRGHIREAFDFHPLIFVTLILIAAYILARIFKLKIFNSTKNKRLNIFLFFVLGLYAVVYAARMILFFPGIEPMTYLDKSFLGRFIGLIKYIVNHFLLF
jgi:hypothetical protein